MVDEPVTRREFDRVVQDHERRLAGHDGLYKDLQETREELVKFTEALQAARLEIGGGSSEHIACKTECARHRDGFEKRVRVLEAFRWKLLGAYAVAVLVLGIPGIGSFIMLLSGGD